MKNKKIIFNKEENAILDSDDIDTGNLAPEEILIKTQYSLISPGTELSIYKGMESWAPLPFNPGYAAVGRVEAVGEAVEDKSIGDMLLTHTSHGEYAVISDKSIHVKLSDDCNYREAVFTRLASISMSALRISDTELGDKVAVLGMGLIGNLAAQLFNLAGADVTAIDICEKRLDIVKQCGINKIFNSKDKKIEENLADFDTVVEATGIPGLVMDAMKITGKRGEVILLGSPRGEYQENIIEFLNQIHLWGNGCVTVKGAHEWRYPKKQTDGCKHSIQRNSDIIARLIADKKLRIDPLITHILSPEEAQSAYQGLLNNKTEYLGVVFDWTEN
ncbi:MAG: zinc-dependent alcohol dehydrogenase [Planctomycetota bacterium]|jgi:2-desacetyl-2-hydroxyethyl bacteriochlorophyllide A dehydrogenase